MAKKKRRVPEVLWRLFHNRARPLADTIISLISLSSFECRCKVRGCLGCAGDEAMSFLRRPDDPSDYHKLLTQCYVVVSDNAPPFSVFDPACRWSQLEIVRRSIEMIMREQPTSSNVICSGYDKAKYVTACHLSGSDFNSSIILVFCGDDFIYIGQHSRSSAIVELLTCSAWGLFLARVGDGIMSYLLKYSSIFLPLSRKKYHQVAGFSTSDLCFNYSKHISKIEFQHPPLVLLGKQYLKSGRRLNFRFAVLFNVELSGFPKKRKRVDEVDSASENWQPSTYFGVDVPYSSVNCAGCSGRSCSVSFSGDCKKKFCEESLYEEASVSNGADDANNKGDPSRNCQESLNQSLAKTRKRFRWYSWRRHRKRKQLTYHETFSLIPCTSSLMNKESLRSCPEKVTFAEVYLLCFQFETMPSQCSCCLVLQTLRGVKECSQINRQPLFYNLERSSYVLPRKHILNSLKPNLSDANVLFKDIFGLSDNNITAQSVTCCHSNSSCLIGFTCIYHSFVKLLKILIHKAQCCQHLRLLDKHCLIQSLNQSTNEHDGSMLEQNECGTVSLAKEYDGFQLEGELCKSYCLKKQVVSFIWAVCRSIIPQDLLGTTSNWRILRKHISSQISSKRNGVRALANLKASSRIPAKQPSFRVQSCGLQGKVSLHPKSVKYDNFRSVNGVLRDLHVVLKGIQLKEPEKLGSSKAAPFLIGFEEQIGHHAGVFIVVSDVSKAFDSINQDKLLTVMKDVALKDGYLLKKSHQVVCAEKSLW
ncbi:unnamed protein product, partial [Ilex paraguariensis]